MTRWTTCLSAAFALSLLSAAPAAAQSSPFAPRLIINEQVVSYYELEQRILFLRLLRSPGDLEKLALDALIEDRLRLQQAEKLEIEVTPEEVLQGMDEFAARANLTSEQFIAAIAEGGVEPETFRDFVEAGLVWRQVVRARFGAQANVTETDVDRAITNEGKIEGVQVLLSELIIPAPEGREEDALALARELSDSISGEDAFARAARQYSAAPSKGRGGRMDWLPLANVPSAIGPFVLGLAPGETSDPVPIPGAVALFQLRGIIEESTETPAATQVEYAQLFLPNDGGFEAEAARIRARADTCNDLYGVVPDATAEQLQRATATMTEIPADIGLELARLDAGESSTAITRGDTRVFLMLCLRQPVPELPDEIEVTAADPGDAEQDGGEAPPAAGPDRDAIRTRLINQKLAGLADNYLADLRANAIIREP